MDLSLDELSAVSSTGLLTLMGRVHSSLDDPEAARLAEAVKPALARSSDPMHQRLARGRVSRRLSLYLAMRARHFDERVRAFAEAHPTGLVVNLAAGLDTRFHRLGGAIEVVDVDLPPMIDLKRALVTETDRYRLIAGSVTERDWLTAIPAHRPVMFLAEGLFMYLPKEEVGRLVVDLTHRHPGAELVAEVFQSGWLTGWRGRITQRRIRRTLGLDPSVKFEFGLRNSEDFETLGRGIRFLGDWSAFDEVGGGLLGRLLPGLRQIQWIVHYRLGEGLPSSFGQLSDGSVT